MKKQICLFLILTLFIIKSESQSLSLPYYTSFDSISQFAGWKQFRLGALTFNLWGAPTPFVPYSCCYSLTHGYNASGSPLDTMEDWYVSPPLKISSPAKLAIKFYIIAPGGRDHGAYIGIWSGSGSNNPASGNFFELANLTNMQPEEQWLDTSAIISSLSDSSYIAFIYIGTNRWFIVGIDNVTITYDTGSFIMESSIQNRAITINPNPVSSIATLEISDSRFTKCDFIIYDVLGLKVHSQTLNSKKETINLNLANGIYFYKVMNRKEEIGGGKLIIQKP